MPASNGAPNWLVLAAGEKGRDPINCGGGGGTPGMVRGGRGTPYGSCMPVKVVNTRGRGVASAPPCPTAPPAPAPLLNIGIGVGGREEGAGMRDDAARPYWPDAILKVGGKKDRSAQRRARIS